MSVLYVLHVQAQQQTLSIKDAEQMALANYASIKSKAHQLNASKASLKETKTEYLMDFNFSAPQDSSTKYEQNNTL